MVLLVGLSLAAADARAVTIRIVNVDGGSEGFNDPAPVAPVGGNPGTTLGQQRLIVFQTAASIWGNALASTVEVKVRATFDPLACAPSLAILGSAGPTGVYATFDGAIFPETWYHSALANRLAGRDLDPGDNDIVARFNSSIDGGCAGAGRVWYYGLDGRETGNSFDLLTVVLHELGHGLGFSTVTDLEDGAFINAIPDVFTRFMLDNQTALHWNEMTSQQRVDSSVNTGHVVWDGPHVTGHAPALLARPGVVRIDAPSSIAGTRSFGIAAFGPSLATPGVTAQVALVQDGVAPTSDACSALVNGSAIAGRIALIDRGSCAFTVKVAEAQAAGAVAAVVINNTNGLQGMGGDDPAITIPSVLVSQADGNQIRNALVGGVTMTLTADDSQPLSGADAAGRVLLYAPNPQESGSSISHWDVSASPNLLMEPVINADVNVELDLTLDQLLDIGWAPGAGSPPVAGAAIGNAYPNPFGATASVPFTIVTPGEVDVSIYDLGGRLVKQLLHEARAAGPGLAAWDGTDESGRRMRQGVYLCKLQVGDYQEARRMVLVE